MFRKQDNEDRIEAERQKLEALIIVSNRAKTQNESKFNAFGLTEVFSPAEHVSIDIVFVHGIFGHPKDTWTCDDTDVFWPADLLPPMIEDYETRILTYGYQAGVESFTDGGKRHHVHKIIENFTRDLASNRLVGKFAPTKLHP